jgi:type IV pilus assembly protein PilY1
MRYPIPSRITVLDTDGDFVDDRLYVGDTGGQVWRVDLAPNVRVSGTGRAGSSVVGRLASLSTIGGSGVDERRFFEPPSVVQVLDTVFSDAAGGEYDYVFIGSGWRQHPLDKDVDDRFYALRDEVTGPMTDSDANNLAESYPADTTGNAPIANSDLIDVTTRILDADDADIAAIKLSKGWFFDFTDAGNDGEKVLSAPITIAGTVFVTTYAPDATTNTDLCQAQIGGGSAYNFNVLSSAATIDWDLDGDVEDLADRTLVLGGGIPSDVVPVFTKEGIVGIVGIEGGAAQLGTLSALPRFRTYWYEESGS